MESHPLSVDFFSSSMFFYSSLHTSSFWACVSDKIYGGTMNIKYICCVVWKNMQKKEQKSVIKYMGKIHMQGGLEKYAEEGKKSQ